MTQSTQGIIIGILISLLIGVIIGFYLRQSRINELSRAVQQSQRRTEELELEHDQRLQAATLKLQQDYEAQLAEKIERYQDQYDSQISQIEAEYQARQSLISQGGSNPNLDSAHPGWAAQSGTYGGMGSGLESAHDIEQRIRKQYETRLKEAAAKIQQAYEQHLKEKLVEAQVLSQKDFDKRLAEAIEHYQDQSEQRIAQASTTQPLYLNALGSEAGLPRAGVVPSPELGADQEVLLQERLASLEAKLQADYEQRLADRIEHYQDEMARRIEQLEQNYAVRLHMMQPSPAVGTDGANEALPHHAAAPELEERLRQDYEQRLAEAIAHHQDEWVQRTEAMEADYAARLQMIQAAQPSVMPNEAAVGAGVATQASEAELRQQIEAALKAEYEQKLAEKIEHYQDKLTKRTEEIEQSVAARLQLLQPPPSTPSDAPSTSNRTTPPGSSSAPTSSVMVANDAPDGIPRSAPEGAMDSAIDFDLDEILTSSSSGAGLGIVATPIPAEETALASPTPETPAAPANQLPLPEEDLFALDTEALDSETLDTEADLNINAEGSNWSSDDSQEFTLDNLDTLLKQSNLDDELSDDLFDSLDDLSNLS